MTSPPACGVPRAGSGPVSLGPSGAPGARPSLSPAFLRGARLPAYAVRGAPMADAQPPTARSVSCGSPCASSGPRTAVKASVRTVSPSSPHSADAANGSSAP